MKHRSLWAALIIVSGATLFAQDIERTFSISGEPRLDVITISGSITISKGKTGKVLVKARRSNDRIEVDMTQSGDRIRIKTRHPFGGRGGSVSLEITMPDGELDVRSTSGEITVEGVSGDLELHSVSGNIDVSRLDGRLRMNGISGNVTMSRLGKAEVDAVSISGNVIYRKGSLQGGDYNFSSTSGNVVLSATADANYTISGRTISGRITDETGKLTIKKAKYSGSQSLSGVVGKGTVMVQANSVSGNVRIEKN
ncbi:MAG: DUF4097 family beta strand repeat-containing protein [Acidobacteriota bacterium]|nr:DUF4097 family beta strand repeat-containing protein [Acidobacteriota bacterium]